MRSDGTVEHSLGFWSLGSHAVPPATPSLRFLATCSLPPGTWAHLASSSPLLPQDHYYPLPGPATRQPQQKGGNLHSLVPFCPWERPGYRCRWGRVRCMSLWCLEWRHPSIFGRCIGGTVPLEQALSVYCCGSYNLLGVACPLCFGALVPSPFIFILHWTLQMM